MQITYGPQTFASTLTVCAECGQEAAIVPNETGRLTTACGHPLNFTIKPNPAVA